MIAPAGRLAALGLAAVLPVAALADETCLAAGFARPLPGAINVRTGFADVPAARFPGHWQEGQILDFAYRLYPDLTGAVGSSPRMTDWRVVVICDAETGRCDTTPTDLAPTRAVAVAEVLGRCLLGQPVTAGDFEALAVAAPVLSPSPADPDAPAIATAGEAARPEPGDAPDSDGADAGQGASTGARVPPTQTARDDPPASTDTASVVADAAPDPAPAAAPAAEPDGPPPAALVQEAPSAPDEPPGAAPNEPAEPCGLDTLPEGPPVLTLQRLLQRAGADPGPLDGLMGRRTRGALVSYLGPQAADLPIAEAIRRVDAELCNG